ncbi:MAG: FecCD family ABC transporter permease [Sedimentisphaeraceae bacterium JB056]
MKKVNFKDLLKSFGIGFLLLLVTISICLFIGSKDISLSNVWSGINGTQANNPDHMIFFEIRLPRCILAAVVGASLALSGAVLQALLRNPLADPYILGISSGAGLGAIIAAVSGVQIAFFGISTMGIFAFIGAIGTVWLVWWIGILAGSRQVTSLLLAGVVVNSFFSAVIMFLTSIMRSSNLQSTMLWLMGNIRDASGSDIFLSTICLFIAGVILYRLAPLLNVLSFGHNDAQTMGVNVTGVRLIAFATAAFVTAVAVSMSGLIGFIGLIVPHAVRLLCGPDHRKLLPICGIAGAIFLVICDTFARTVIAPQQLPVGIVTAITGGPFFLFLLVKYSRKVSIGSK